jgi:hypothetical protein
VLLPLLLLAWWQSPERRLHRTSSRCAAWILRNGMRRAGQSYLSHTAGFASQAVSPPTSEVIHVSACATTKVMTDRVLSQVPAVYTLQLRASAHAQQQS